jgi:hypothetical protein
MRKSTFCTRSALGGSKGGCRWDDDDGREQDESTTATRFRGVAPVKTDLAVSSLDYVMGVAAPGSTKGELWSVNLPIWGRDGRAGASVWLDRRFLRPGATGNCVRCLAPSTTSRYFDFGRCGANGLSMLAGSNFQRKRCWRLSTMTPPDDLMGGVIV